MSLFLGEYAPTLTEGSRISLPKKLRAEIQGRTVVLSKGFDGCIFVYGMKHWENRAESRIEKRRGSGSVEELERYIFASAVVTPIDAQGRFVIPANLLKHARITKETSVVGVGDHIEIWNRDLWNEYSDRVTKKWGSYA